MYVDKYFFYSISATININKSITHKNTSFLAKITVCSLFVIYLYGRFAVYLYGRLSPVTLQSTEKCK